MTRATPSKTPPTERACEPLRPPEATPCGVAFCCAAGRHQPPRLIDSPTRNALAMIVSVGLVAPIDGMNDASTT